MSLAIASVSSMHSANAAPDDSCGVPSEPERCALWNASFDGAGGADRYNDLVVSPDGSMIFATGETGAGDGQFKYMTSAYGSEGGNEVWTATYDGEGAGNDFARAIAVSPEGGSIYITGQSDGAGTFGDFTTVSYDAFTGDQRWVARFDGPAGTTDNAVAVAVSPDGARVYITGYADLPGVAGRIGTFTLAYDSYTGDEIWQQQHEGPGAFWDIPRALTVTKWGDADRVLLATRSNVQGTGNNQVDAGLIAYEGETGAIAWERYYDYYGDGSSREEPWAITTTRDGTRAYVVAEGPFGFNTLAYTVADGSFLWRGVYNGSSRPLGIAVSPSGDTIVSTGAAMHQQAGNVYRGVDTVAYNADGTQKWSNRFFPAGGGTGYRVAFEPGGRHVYVAGLLVGQAVVGGVGGVGGAQASYSGLLTVGFDATNGTKVWQATAKESGGANGLAVHPNGARVFVAGGATDAVAAGYDTGFEPPSVPVPTLTVSPTTINAANQHAITLSGTARVDTGVIVVVADQFQGRGCSLWSIDGTYTCTTDVSSLPDGMLEARARAYDGIGGYSDFVRIPILKDTTVAAPSLTTPASINATTASAVGLTGTAEPGASISLAITDGVGTATGSTTAAANGTFSGTVNASALADGTLTASASQTDTAGNTGPAVTKSTVKDTVAPAAPVILTPGTGSSTPSGVHFTGTVQPGAIVTVLEGTVTKGVATADGSGSWSLNAPFAAGARTAIARARDAAGNISADASVSFTVVAPPSPVITSPETDATTRGAVTITGTAAQGLRVRVLDGTRSLGTVYATDGTWKVTTTLSDGNHTLSAVTLDTAGSTSAPSASVVITVDATRPTLGVTTADRSVYTDGATVAGTAKDERNVARIELQVLDPLGDSVLTIDAECTGCGTADPATWTANLEVGPGIYTVQAVAYDAAGNASTARRITIVTI